MKILLSTVSVCIAVVSVLCTLSSLTPLLYKTHNMAGRREGGPAQAVQHSMFAAVVMIVSNAAGLRVVTGKLHSSHCKLVFSDKNDLE